jgi:serine/threonine protein kinase/tetratricopeptide (TPR) repeat protein
MSPNVKNSGENPRLQATPQELSGSRACSTCNTPLTRDNLGDFCPVCMLKAALNETLEFSGEELAVSPKPGETKSRFEHYELVRREDGAPLELGRGAMGVTFKAVDTNLRFTVALKVINAQYLDSQVMRRRFVSEARAAASLRHPNVASVFHLGKTGEDYFYAMEFVEGETLDRILMYRGPLEVGLALDIVEQVDAALSAAYRQNIVHRDIKPSNLMLTFGEGGRATVKVIDFGLARQIRVPASELRLSEAGMFVGTPHFSSPEQCFGKEADIRSDLYSLGVTLWVMLTGKVPFDGSTLEVMQKHQHEALPLERLEGVPKPVVSLIESLLEKDPAKRPQTPFQLQSMIQEMREALGADQPRWDRFSKVIQINRRRYGSRRGQLTIAITLVLGIAVACFYSVYQRGPPPIDPKSVAVLPFDNVGEQKQNEYFGDGLTTEVIFQLSKISDLRVTSRSSVLRYKAAPPAGRKNLREIAAELEVATILESTVQRAENRVKIVAILYDARTNRRLWGESYDREITDLFAIQSDVAQKIAAALQVKLSADERTNIQQRPTENLTAYDLYLRGQASYELIHKDDNEKAIVYFQQALETDPNFALGYAGLANAYIQRTTRFAGEDFWVDSAISLCQRAIILDPAQARGYAVLARAFFYKGWLDKARESIQKALRIAPNDEEVNIRAANLLAETTEFADWYAAVRKCASLNPEDPSQPYLLGAICKVVGDNELMEKWMQRAIVLEVDPDRRQLMQCEQMVFRRNFRGALESLRQLPLEASAYSTGAMELVVGCSERVGDWPSVLRLTSAALEKGGNEQWACLHLALALRASGRDAEARQKMQRLMDSARAKLALKENDALANWYLAATNRFFGRKDEAYQYLRTIFPRMVEYLDLLRDDRSLELFAPDVEFQTMNSHFDRKNEFYRARIREIERTFAKGSS